MVEPNFVAGLVIGAFNRTTHDQPVTADELLTAMAADEPSALMALLEESYLRGYQQGCVDAAFSLDLINSTED